MSGRARRPTDELGGELPHAEPQGSLGGVAARTARQDVSSEPHDSFELDATQVTPLPGRPAVERATPTTIAPPPRAIRQTERSEPIRVVSMKDQLGAEPRHVAEPAVARQVQLRPIGKIARRPDTPLGLGNLAPPRDPRQVRARRVRAHLVRAGVALALAGAIAAAIWLVAGG
jgi:hypothetical protein